MKEIPRGVSATSLFGAFEGIRKGETLGWPQPQQTKRDPSHGHPGQPIGLVNGKVMDPQGPTMLFVHLPPFLQSSFSYPVTFLTLAFNKCFLYAQWHSMTYLVKNDIIRGKT